MSHAIINIFFSVFSFIFCRIFWERAGCADACEKNEGKFRHFLYFSFLRALLEANNFRNFFLFFFHRSELSWTMEKMQKYRSGISKVVWLVNTTNLGLDKVPWAEVQQVLSELMFQVFPKIMPICMWWRTTFGS